MTSHEVPAGHTARNARIVAPPTLLLRAVVILLVLAKLWLTLAAPPIGDEAYYWMWGQRPDWSYFDHPPLHAWLLGIVSLLGWNHLTLRLLTWLTFAGTLWIFWLWARRLNPADPAAWWWPTVAIYLATPLFFLMSSIAFHDHLLIFLCLASAHAFLIFAESWESGDPRYRWLYVGAMVLGLAVLTKYNGVLLGLGIALFFVLHRPVRSTWRSPHLYVAALLSVAMQAPVLGWNLTRGFASYDFHLSGRWGGELFRLQPLHLLEFIAVTLIVASPFIVPAIIGILRKRRGDPFADRARTFALSVFAVSTLAMLFLSLFVEIFFYWNIVALVLLMPLLAGWIGRWALRLHLVYGFAGAALCILNFSLVPIGNLIGQYDWTSSSAYGWPRVAERIEALKAEHDIGFVAATRYTMAAQLGFALGDPDVVALAARQDQYDYWFDAEAHSGQAALVVADPIQGIGHVSRHFGSLVEIEAVPFERWENVIYRPQIYLGLDFSPAPMADR